MSNEDKLVLSLCDYTGVAVLPWRDAGYRCVCVDTQHPCGVTYSDGIEYVGKNILDYSPPDGGYAFVFAFPPCTHLAASGARWFGDKGLWALYEAIGLVARCRDIAEASKAPYLIENPVSTLSTYWRKPDHTFDPCEYGGYLDPPGDKYTKKTCLWTGGGFRMPTSMPVSPTEGSKMHLMSPGPERANLRSATPRGFARAVFLANSLP